MNIAARLQQLADPGGICVSAKVAKEVEKKLAFVFEPMGEQRVKNVAEPINVFKVKLDSVPLIKAPKQPLISLGHRTFVAALAVAVPLVLIAGISAWQWFSPMDHSKPLPQTAAVDAKPTLVVLPFDNLSDSKEQGYLADGFTEDLVTELARAPGLFVISRNSAFSYKGKDVSPAKLAAELGVRYILEGSIRRAGDDVRINAQLIDSKTGGHLWAERFDASWSEVFSLQDKVIKNVVSALELRLVQGQQTTQIPGGTKLAAAYDAYLQGLELFFRDTPADLAKAVPALEKAVSLDPNYGQAYAVLASVYWRALGQWEDALGVTSREATKRTDLYLDEALKHPSARAYRLIADRLQYQQKIDEAITYLERAIPLDPSDASVYGKMAEVLLTDGRPAQAQGYLDATLRLDPVSAPYYANLAGETQFCSNQFEMAAKTLEKDVATNPDHPAPVILLVATYGHLGRTSDAPRLVQKLNSIAVRGHADMGTQLWARGFYPYKQPADAERLREGLRKAGVPELPFGYDSLSKNRLSGDDIRSKFFGHKTDGKDIDSAEECSYSWTTDGGRAVRVGSLQTPKDYLSSKKEAFVTGGRSWAEIVR
jgi:adenylate cyclase